MATTWARSEGRQALGRLMHGHEMVTGTPGATLAVNTFGVAKLASFKDDYFNEWHGRFYAGPHIDTDFEVSDFTQSTALVTFLPALGEAVVASDLFEMYAEFSPAEMDDAINSAIRTVEKEALEDHRDESVRVVASQWEYDIPPEFTSIHQVFEASSTAGRFSPSAELVDVRHWRILPGSPPRLWFDDQLASLTAGRVLRIVGQKAPAPLTSDAQLCAVNQSFVLYQAKADLHFSRVEEVDDAHYKRMLVGQARAQQERTLVRVPQGGLAVSN